MSEVLSSSDSKLREPVLVALVVVLIAYIITQYFKCRGCPFAKGSRAAAPKPIMASAVGSLRLTLAQLAEYDGKDPSKPLYIAVRGKIYDVSAGKTFYGPGTGPLGC